MTKKPDVTGAVDTYTIVEVERLPPRFDGDTRLRIRRANGVEEEATGVFAETVLDRMRKGRLP